MLNKKSLLVLIMLLSLLGLAAFFFWPTVNSKQDKWTPERVEPFKQWYQINWQNQAVGWASLELKKTDKVIRVIEQDFITGRVQSERMEFSFKRELTFDNKIPYQLLGVKINSNEPSLKVEKVIHNENKLLAIETRNSKTKKTRHSKVSYTLTDYLALYHWLEKPRREALLLAKEFNNDDYGLHYSRYQIIDKPTKQSPYFVVKHQLQNSSNINDNYQSEASKLTFSKDFRLVREEKANGMTFVASDGKVTVNPEMQRDLYTASGIKINQALGKATSINALELSFPKQFKKQINTHPALKIDDNRLKLQKGYRYSAKTSPVIDEAHPRAKKLANILISGINSKREKIKTLLTYVNQQLTYQTLPASFEVDDILDNKIGDCTEHALLLSEMLNGIGIPARQVSGLVYLGDQKQRFGGHVWVEVYVDGYWQAIDPSWNLLSVTATHIPLVIGADKTPEILQNASEFEFKLIKIN